MPLETGTTIAALNSTNPLVGDIISQGDDHIRLLKAVLKATFPGAAAAGFAIPITATEAQLNFVTGVTSSIQTQIDSKAAKGANTDITSLTPSGTIMAGGAITSGASITAATGITITAGQLVSTNAWNATNNLGQVYLNGVTGNRIDFNANGSAIPAVTTRSAGTKFVLSPTLSGAAVDYAIGIEPNSVWYSIPTTSQSYKWYAGTTVIASLSGAGIFTATGGIIVGGSITSNNATSGIGYAVGAGGTVVQVTSKATAVTLNKVCGTITINNAALAANAVVSFTLNNSAISGFDNVFINQINGTLGAYLLNVAVTGAGVATVSITNISTGSIAEAFAVRFTVFGGTNS